MKIGLDGGMLGITDDRLKVGVYRVAFNLLQYLPQINPHDQYAVFSFTKLESSSRGLLTDRIRSHVLRPSLGFMRLWLPYAIRREKIDVFLGLAQALPNVAQYRFLLGQPSANPVQIGFIYDVGFLFHPELYGSAAAHLVLQTKNLVARADHIITISSSTKRDIVKEYGVSSDRITVSYPGVDSQFMPEGESYKHSRPYFLFVGSLNKTKNIPFLLRSFRLFLDDTKKEIDLLLVGGEYWPDPQIDETIMSLGLSRCVKKVGFVSDKALASLYRGARALVVASAREGFCIPAAEAMATGLPVVAADNGALKEVVGGGGIVVHPVAEETFASAMSRIALNDTTWKELRQRAMKQASSYTWQVFARTIYEIISSYDHSQD